MPTALILSHRFGEQLDQLCEEFDERALQSLVAEVSEARTTLGEKLENGYLRLLARNSNKPGQSEVLREQIQACDTDSAFETFATDLMEYVGLRVEDLGDRRYLFKPEYGQIDSLPGLDPKGMMATFDRTDALNRDDIQFFTTDHPLLRNSLDSLLSSEKGNAVLSVYQGTEAPGIFLQVTYLVECLAPRHLHIDRYLGITPITLWLNHTGRSDRFSRSIRGQDSTHTRIPMTFWATPVSSASSKKCENPPRAHMFHGLTQEDRCRSPDLVEQELQSEISRLQMLARLNPSVDQSEIKNLQTHQAAIEEALAETRYRLDSLHLVVVES